MATHQENPPATSPQTLKIANDARLYIYAAAFASFLLSIWLWFGGDKQSGMFVGLWVPSILSAGILLMTKGDHHD